MKCLDAAPSTLLDSVEVVECEVPVLIDTSQLLEGVYCATGYKNGEFTSAEFSIDSEGVRTVINTSQSPDSFFEFISINDSQLALTMASGITPVDINYSVTRK